MHPYWQSYDIEDICPVFARELASKFFLTKSKISHFQQLITSQQDVSWFKADNAWILQEKGFLLMSFFCTNDNIKTNVITVQRGSENQTSKVRALLAISAVLKSSFDVE